MYYQPVQKLLLKKNNQISSQPIIVQQITTRQASSSLNKKPDIFTYNTPRYQTELKQFVSQRQQEIHSDSHFAKLFINLQEENQILKQQLNNLEQKVQAASQRLKFLKEQQ